jgi:DNA-binding CsgD family transcriptional regulator
MNLGAGTADPLEGPLAQAADALAWPMLLLGEDAELLWANRAATALLAQHRLLSQREGRLQATWLARFALTALLQAAQQDLGPVLLHAPSMSVTLTARALAPPPRPRWMLLLSAGGGPADKGLAESAGVRAWAEAHGLSGAETRVLLRVAAGDSPGDAAAALGVAPATVRTQLRAIARKTGLGGAAALQRALSRLPHLASAPR